MIYGLMLIGYIFIGILLILIILLQKGKGSLGLGSLSGGSQILFGGSGGQDLFQKVTWILGALFMAGSLVLALMKNRNYSQSRYLTPTVQTQPAQLPAPEAVPAQSTPQAKQPEVTKSTPAQKTETSATTKEVATVPVQKELPKNVIPKKTDTIQSPNKKIVPTSSTGPTSPRPNLGEK